MANETINSPELIKALSMRLQALPPRKAVIMEVCGTHTQTIMKNGIRSLLPSGVRLISGPGCPVCVTPEGYIDAAIILALEHDVHILTFGDLLRVPGTKMSLLEAKAQGANIKIVYSPLDAVKYATENKNIKVVFLSIGFETTTPGSALAVKEAKRLGLNNFYLLTSLRTMPKALELLLGQSERPDAFLFPGHVSAITGVGMFRQLCDSHGLTGVCAGFEAAEVIASIIYMLINYDNRPFCHNLYTRVVSEQGNLEAQALINDVFTPCDIHWRGFGEIKGSGLCLSDKYKSQDAAEAFGLKISEASVNNGCICGEIMRGIKDPNQCPLFGIACTPQSPKGACMVSTEGACHIWNSEQI